LSDRLTVEAGLSDSVSRAGFLAAVAPHSGDWLLALPVAACGMRLDDEAVRVAVGLRLGLELCQSHTCPCGAQVDTSGQHGFVCRKAPSRIIRHHCLNDTIARAFTSASIPVTKEPTGLSRADGKRPDGLTLIPWQGGKALTWDVTVTSTQAASFVTTAARESAAAAELAATRKCAKYANLPPAYIFLPIAFETLGAVNSSALECLTELGRRISQVTGDERETTFLFQRISVTLQRFNAALLHESFINAPTELDL